MELVKQFRVNFICIIFYQHVFFVRVRVDLVQQTCVRVCVCYRSYIGGGLALHRLRIRHVCLLQLNEHICTHLHTYICICVQATVRVVDARCKELIITVLVAKVAVVIVIESALVNAAAHDNDDCEKSMLINAI